VHPAIDAHQGGAATSCRYFRETWLGPPIKVAGPLVDQIEQRCIATRNG
jgi:hypothetical protein